MSGETALRGSAENRRAINVTFTNAPTESGADEYRRFKNLMGDAVEDDDGNVVFPDSNYPLGDHAVSYYRYVTGVSDEEFENEWFSAREYVSKRLAGWDVELDDMEVQGLQTVAFGFEMLRSFAEDVGADLGKLPGHDELDNALRYIADVEGDGRELHTDQFLLLVQRATAVGALEEDTHWRVVNAGKADEELRINVTRAFDAVSKYVRDHDLSEDLLGSSRDYKSRFSEAEGQDSYVTTTSQNTHPINRCVGIDTDRAAEELAEFNREVFIGTDDSVPLDPELVGDDDDDSDGDGPTPISGLDPGANDTGFATVTARVTKWSDGPDESKLAQSGTVKDSSGAIRVVAFEPFDARTTSHGPIDENDYIRLKDVVVDSFDENTQLIIEDGTTEIESIQPGVGTSKPIESPDQQETVNDADSDDGSREDDTVGAGARETGQGAVRADSGAGTSSPSDVAEAAVSRVVGRYPDEDTVTRTAVWDCFRATTNGGKA